VAPQQRRGGELQHGAGNLVGIGPAEHARVAILDQRGGAAFGHGVNGDAAGAGLEHDLAICIGGRAEEEDVGAGISPGEGLAFEPTEECGVLSQAETQLLFLRTTAGEQQVEPGIDRPRAQEALGEQVDSLLAGQATGVEPLDLAGIVSWSVIVTKSIPRRLASS
jgi:hypothetical protein